MPFEIDFATMLEYATRGKNDVALKSRQIAGNFKAGNVQVIERLIYHIQQLPDEHPITQMFADNPILVPTPRSAPILEGGLWPTRVLCEHLVNHGLGGLVENFLVRFYRVPKSSSFSSADQRPSCNTHFKSLLVVPPAAFVKKIILVDDIFTLGRTSCACVRKLHESFPDADIRVFSAMRTRGFVNTLDYIVKPSYNTMIYYPESDAVQLPD